ncbi:MAG: CinA family protein [Gammaproteobacteria bacterium]|nr:CinA family protein [Gammaproteobacteria bacterium]
MNYDDVDLNAQARQLGQFLVEKKLKMATAESCTGGWVSKSITDLDGSSNWFECGLVTYSNQAKQDFLGVSAQTLLDHGAVSQPVVKEMALGLLDRCNADIGVSISGVAGPGGGSDDKPVGTVWIAWAKPGEVIEAVKFKFDGDREAVRRQAVSEALLGVQRLLEQTC